ncbi:MAG TPA: peptidylprolyl isomerase [Smithellaceae bacterium]|nr:peptidylprolyl isomerase [Smithellaceae bacterium]
MKRMINRKWIAVLAVFSLVFIIGCGKAEEKQKETKSGDVAVGTNQLPAVTPSAEVKEFELRNAAVIVDGKILKKSVVKKEIKKLVKINKDRIPKEKLKEVQADMKKQLIEEFIVRTVLNNEVEKRKITAEEAEVQQTIKQIEAGMAKDKTLEDLLKEHKMTKDKFNKEIAFSVKVKKLVDMETSGKGKANDKEISKFYNENKDKFTEQAMSHVRHILVKVEPTDDAKIKAEKKVKIEGIRKKLIGGADFAELAKKDSDCPSKEKGGDLGFIGKGETVKQFENAAFTQAKNVIGPVVTTEYGYHVIQVLERQEQKVKKLDEVRKNIAAYLENEKKREAVTSLIKRLRAEAKITILDK